MTDWMDEYELYKKYDEQCIPFELARQNWILYNQQLLPLKRVLELIRLENE